MEYRISELKDRNIEIPREQSKKNFKKSEVSQCDWWESIRHTNIGIIWVPKGEEKHGRKFI